jgi:hypothetical protein
MPPIGLRPPASFVYQARKNADMTEGRGPMIAVFTFTKLELAADYIDRQQGVMGRRAKWSQENHGDWDIIEIPVYDYTPTEEDLVRERALAKLSPAEKKALGF